MYNREEELLEKYELDIRSTGKGRGACICDTAMGCKLLKQFRGSRERAEFLEDILKFISEQGFVVETIFRNREGEILTVDDEEDTYWMKNWFIGKECDVKNRGEILTAVKKLAGFHNLTKCYEKEIPAFMIADKNELWMEYERHNRELIKVKNYIRSKHQKNDFELLFMKVYEIYLAQATEVTKEVEAQLREIDPKQQEAMLGICHGDYNQHNILFCQGEVVLINFEQMSYKMMVSDLANFMRKILEKYNWNTGLGIEMISAYDQVRKLLPQELRQLYLRLSYPQKYWKIANHYYNSRKTWISARNIEKLEKMIRQEEDRKQFLRMLFYFMGNSPKGLHCEGAEENN